MKDNGNTVKVIQARITDKRLRCNLLKLAKERKLPIHPLDGGVYSANLPEKYPYVLFDEERGFGFVDIKVLNCVSPNRFEEFIKYFEIPKLCALDKYYIAKIFKDGRVMVGCRSFSRRAIAKFVDTWLNTATY